MHLKRGAGEKCLEWTDKVTNDEVFQRAKEEISLLKNLEKQAPLGDRAYN
jgi:hypothetical protein